VKSRGTAWSRSGAARSMASTATSPRCCNPAPGRSGELGEEEAGGFGSAKGRLDHGRFRFGRRRPWLGPLRLRSSHARRCFLRRPPCRPDGDVGVRRRSSAGRAATWGSGGAAVQPPLSSFSSSSPPGPFLFPPESAARAGAWRLRGPAARPTHQSSPQLLPRL
jgi:hypothetical protein